LQFQSYDLAFSADINAGSLELCYYLSNTFKASLCATRHHSISLYVTPHITTHHPQIPTNSMGIDGRIQYSICLTKLVAKLLDPDLRRL